MFKKNQRGFTLITWMLILAIIAFFAMFLIKLLPVYLEAFNVQSSISSLSKNGSGGSSATEIRGMLVRRLDINNVDSVAKEDILINRQGPFYVVSIDYVNQVHFIGNVDFLVSFEFEERVKAN